MYYKNVHLQCYAKVLLINNNVIPNKRLVINSLKKNFLLVKYHDNSKLSRFFRLLHILCS